MPQEQKDAIAHANEKVSSAIERAKLIIDIIRAEQERYKAEVFPIEKMNEGAKKITEKNRE